MSKNEQKLKAIIKENNEKAKQTELEEYEKNQEDLRAKARKQLQKAKYEDLIEDKVEQMESQALSNKSIGNMGLIANKSFGWIEPIEVLDDKKLRHTGNKEVAVFHDPISVYMDMRNFWIIGGLLQRIKYMIVVFWMRILGMDYIGRLRFNLYVFRSDGEYTLNPTEDQTPWKAQRMVEEYLKIANPADQGKALAKMQEGLGDADPWWKTGMWLITILLICFMFLYVMNGGGV